MKRSLITMTLAALAMVAVALPAQVEPAPYITIHQDRVDPEHMMAYEANSKEWVEAFAGAEAGDDFYWRGYQSGFTYAWVSDMENYGWLDGIEEREKMLGEKVGEEKMKGLMSGAGDAIIEHHTEIWKYQPELSYMPEGFSPEGMSAVSVSTVKVKPSKGSQYREVVQEAVAALQKLGAKDVNFFAYSVPFGAGSYIFVTWGADRGALHSGPEMGELLNEAVGEEKMKEMYGRYLGAVEAEEERDWRARPDLSYMGAGEMADAEAMD